MRTRGLVLSIVVVAGIGVTIAKWPRQATARIDWKPLPTAAVKRTNFDITLRVPGVLESAKTEPVVNMVPQTQVAWVASEGTMVNAGDTIIKLNSTDITKRLTDQEWQNIYRAQAKRPGWVSSYLANNQGEQY